MIFAMNIGNTNFTISWKDGEHIHTIRHSSNEFESQDDFESIIRCEICSRMAISKTEIGVIVSSVNPNLTQFLGSAIKNVLSVIPKIVTASINMKLNLAGYDTGLIGSDRIAVCEGAIAKYRAPLMVFDFGTATTMNVIDGNCVFLGGAIMPGLMMGVNALSKNTALLPLCECLFSPPLFGRNTRECIASGAIFGNASMLDGMIKRGLVELGCEMNVLITGGNAEFIASVCEHKVIHEPNLLIEGLYALYEQNL